MVKLTVAIPVYNGESFLSEAIQSILDQSFHDFELVIVDDRSTDKTPEIVRSFTDPRVRFSRNEDRLGIPGNWNKCLSMAQGEFICIFHQDDVMLPGNLEQKVQLLSTDSSLGFVHSSAELLVESSAPSPPVDWIERSEKDFRADGREYFFKLLFRGNIICAPTVIARKQLLVDLGGFDDELSFTSDYEMWMKACVRYRVGFLSHPYIRYRWHAKNASHDFRFERGVEESLLAARRALSFYLKESGRSAEEPLLREALAGIGRVKIWASGVARAEEDLQREKENFKKVIAEQRDWIEKDKAWLEGELDRLRRASQDQLKQTHDLEVGLRKQEVHIAEQEKFLQEKDNWIRELEKGKDWLDNQRLTWQKMAQDLLPKIEMKLARQEKEIKWGLVAVIAASVIVSPLVTLLLAKLLGLLK